MIKYEHARSIYGHTPNLHEYTIRGWLEICDAGHGSSTNEIFPPDSRVIYARDTDLDMIVGIIVYHHPNENTVFIDIGYVSPDYRSMKIYQKMYAELADLSWDSGYAVIESMVNPDNKPMLALAETQGREIAGYIIRHKLNGEFENE